MRRNKFGEYLMITGIIMVLLPTIVASGWSYYFGKELFNDIILYATLVTGLIIALIGELLHKR
mgnify:CR=1 FL=1